MLHKKRKPNILISALTCCILFCTQELFAQFDCSQNLKNAQKQYDEGIIEKVPSTLENCLYSYSGEEKQQAYKLIIMSYLFDDNDKQADRYAVKLLTLNPDYKTNPVSDPKEFTQLLESFRTLPVNSMGLFGGVNKTQINVIQPYGLDNVSESKGTYNTKNISGYQLGARFNFFLFNNCELSAEMMVANNKFQYTQKMFGTTKLTFNESENWLQIPLSLTYDFGKGRTKLYIRGGYSYGLLVGASSTQNRTYFGNVTLANVDGPAEDLTQLRRKNNSWALAGVGLKIKLKKAHLFFETRYNYGLQNVVNTSKRYENSELLFKYYYLDNDFYINNLMFSVGYMYSFYKPKKKHRKN